MTYIRLKTVILRGNFVKAEMMDKLDTYLMLDRITLEQYNELAALVNAKEV